LKHQNITHQIIRAAYTVYNTLGFGFLESVYKKAMIIELSKNLEIESEKPLKVFYENNVVGEFFVDLFVQNEIIVELKSVTNIAKEHEVQLVNYLNGLEKEIGLLINFGPTGVEVKRKYRDQEIPERKSKKNHNGTLE
jgi:GxxExxY protein